MSAGVAMGVMDYPNMMSKAVLYTMSRAWQLGRVVYRARHTHSPVLAAITEQQNGLVIISGKVENKIMLVMYFVCHLVVMVTIR